MHGVEAFRFSLRQVLKAQRQDAEARLLDALQNLTGMPGLHGVRLDDGECTFHVLGD